MKTTKLFLSLSLATLFLSQAHAMGRAMPNIENESLQETQASQNFQLRATDGSLLNILSEASKSQRLQSVLPPENGAKHSLCASRTLESISWMVDLAGIATEVVTKGRALTTQESAKIAKTPRCEAFNGFLNAIASEVQKSNPVDLGESLSSVSLKPDAKSGTAMLLLNTKTGKSAAFRMTADLKNIKDTRDLEKVQILAAQSGQNIGIRFKVEDMDMNEPSYDRDFENCTTPRGHNGVRRVHTRSQSTFYKISMQMVDLNGTLLLKASLSDVDFDYDRRPGECRGY